MLVYSRPSPPHRAQAGARPRTRRSPDEGCGSLVAALTEVRGTAGAVPRPASVAQRGFNSSRAGPGRGLLGLRPPEARQPQTPRCSPREAGGLPGPGRVGPAPRARPGAPSQPPYLPTGPGRCRSAGARPPLPLSLPPPPPPPPDPAVDRPPLPAPRGGDTPPCPALRRLASHWSDPPRVPAPLSSALSLVGRKGE